MRKITISISLRHLATCLLICCCWHTTVQPGAVRGGVEYEKKQREKRRVYYDLENALAKFADALDGAEQKALKNRSGTDTANAVQAAQEAWQNVQAAIAALKKAALNPTVGQDTRINNLKERLGALENYVKNPPQKSRSSSVSSVSSEENEEQEQIVQQPQRQRAASASAVLETEIVSQTAPPPSVSLGEGRERGGQVGKNVKTTKIKDELSRIETEQQLYVKKWTDLGIEKKGISDFDKQYETRKSLLNKQKDRLLEIKKELLELERFSANEKSWSDIFQENKRLLCFNEIDHGIFNISKEIDSLNLLFTTNKQQKAKELRSKIEVLRLNAANSPVALQALAQKEQALNQIAKPPRKSMLQRSQQVVATFTQQSEDNDRAKNFASNIFAIQQPKKQILIKSFIANVRKLDQERQKTILETVQKINFELALTLEDALKQTTTDVIGELDKINRDRLKYAQAEANVLLKAIQKQATTIQALAENIAASEEPKDIQTLYATMNVTQQEMTTNKDRLDSLVKQWSSSQIITDCLNQAGQILLETSNLIRETRLKVEPLQQHAEGN